ncbi:LOW QUALITY PROTEIN: TOX high mobility group box family member 2 [Chanos chanos]|uniref:LOW QUALITY PROTEIN: TOX high mobility group box family member 2 n=1 Tax=Chanos chanos TaxID=29144 RepID=A0A6J2VRQ2_CHACN|nr:LOW QUALITY PROTEIN: TOX high mobility group box family member 2 [Chanos chanos]
MDVRFYPAPPSSVGSCSLPTDSSLSSLDYYHCNKNRYTVGERGLRLYGGMPLRPNPDGKRLPSTGFDADNMYMNDSSQDFLSPSQQNYSGQGGGSGNGGGGGDEDYEIPPITPPNHPEPPLLHLMDPESSYLCHSLPHNGLINPYSYPELPALMMSNMLAQDGHLLSGQMPSIQTVTGQDGSRYPSARPAPMLNRSPRIPPHPMSALSQLSSQIGRGTRMHGSPSPPGSQSATPSPSSSAQEEEADYHSKITGEKRPSSEMTKPKPKPQKKKKKKDPNEPQKPVSAYALFFRDTQAAIKGQNPNATFGDVSKIVASMWDSLGEEQKQAYKRKTEAAKKEYLKALAAYRASLVSKTYNDPVDSKTGQSSQPSHMLPPTPPLYSVPPQPSSPYLGPSPFPLSDLQSYPGAPRHGLPRSAMLPTLSASPPASFQISPPLHQQLSLHQGSLLNQPIRMQQVQSQPIIPHQMGLQPPLHSPPPGQQGFSHLPSEYQKSVGGSQSPGGPNPGGQNPDWDSEYCNRECGGNHCSMTPRDKPLYLT